MSDEPQTNDQEETQSEALTEMETLQAQAEEYKLGWQRAVADYQNLQKEMAAKRGEWAEMSEQYILEEFIPVYDNFKKAFASWDDTNINSANGTNAKLLNWKQGIEYIMRQFKDVLKSHKVEEIKTVGEQFDPKFHEAAGEEAIEGKTSGEIVREVDGGYVMNGRVVKVAKVIIVK